jgi:hypothetical protein
LPDLPEQAHPGAGSLVFSRWHRFTHYDSADGRSSDRLDSSPQNMGDDAPAHVSFKSNLTLKKGPLHAKAVFERAQARFNACSPALATPKPALFLARSSARAKRR